jgi:TPR repeat protein
MQRNRFPITTLWLAAGIVASSLLMTTVLSAQDDPLLKFSPEPPPAPPRSQNLYDVLSAPPKSPLGESAAGLDGDQMSERVQNYRSGSGGRQQNQEEANYWLRQLAVRPLRDQGNHARWALETLANEWLPENPDGRDAATMRRLQLVWELLALSGDYRAMCNLGFMYEGGIGVPRDIAIAREWLERAAAAGCREAGPALSKLN